MLYELLPRIPQPPFSPGVLGPGFTLCVVGGGRGLRVFVETPTSPDTLKSFFGVSKSSYEDLLKVFGGGVRASDARLKSSFDFWFTDVVVSDLPGLVNSLGDEVGGVCVSVSRDPGLRLVFTNHVTKLMSRAVSEQAKLLRSRINRVMLGKVLALALSKQGQKTVEELVEASTNVRLRWERRKVRKPEELEKLLQPPRVGLWERLFGERNKVVFNEESLKDVVKLPDPSLHRIKFVRGSPLPIIVPERAGERAFRVGVLEDGREFRLSVEDLFRHVYVIGQTGSGKTSFIKMLVHRLKELKDASIVVIDPHGDMARELAEEIPEALYLHPIRSPFGLNPLDLPKTEDRDHAVTIAIDILLEMFKEVLKLMETAVNVKYLLQVILRTLYSRSDNPTMADLYNTILALYMGELDLDVDEPEWRSQVKALQNMQGQTFISALSRLESYAHDKLLLKLTSKTTVNVDKLLNPGSTTVFSVPKADLGEGLARLMSSTIVMKLWFEALARARLGRRRTPLFLVIDEFQLVADLPIIETILSEARKYGLHLIIAHQHTWQIPQQLLQSVLTNCAVKVAFMVGGNDVKRLSMMDASYADALARTLTGLTVGRAVVKVTARPGEQQSPPAVIQLDRIPHEVRRTNIYTDSLDPGDIIKPDLRGVLNPVLKYVVPPRPLEQYVLYLAYRALRERRELSVTDIATSVGMSRKSVEEVVGRLSLLGMIEVEVVGGRRVVRFVKGLFKGLRAVAPSDEGFRIAKNAVIHYLRSGFYVALARQDASLKAKPDLVAIPIDRAVWRPLYSRAVAVEVESCNEVETHPEQVVRNWVKESVRDFTEIHTWTSEECAQRVKELLEKQLNDVRSKVKVFTTNPSSVHMRGGGLPTYGSGKSW